MTNCDHILKYCTKYDSFETKDGCLNCHKSDESGNCYEGNYIMIDLQNLTCYKCNKQLYKNDNHRLK